MGQIKYKFISKTNRIGWKFGAILNLNALNGDSTLEQKKLTIEVYFQYWMEKNKKEV